MEKNELLMALVLDGLGSEAVEWVANETDRIIAEKALKINLWPSKRYSAAYKKWNLSGQKFIFKILPAEEIGVKLKESCKF